MLPTEPLPLYHSWPLTDVSQRFDLGHLHDDDRLTDGEGRAGRWAYDLRGDRLEWAPEVRRLFGFDVDDVQPDRATAVALYAEGSRAAMERLRRHAIRHQRGFTLDIEIFPLRAHRRWLRLVAAPVCEDGHVVRLHGWKADVSHLYGRGAA